MKLEFRIRLLLWMFIVGLVISGATAIPLHAEMNWLAGILGISETPSPNQSGLLNWLSEVRHGINATDANYPFISYGSDWLAFGHFAIAIAFIGPLRDPVKNIWVIEFGMIACALVVPFALVMGGLRGIPVYWRLIDCSFGVVGIAALWVCHRWIRALARAAPIQKPTS